MNRDDLTQYLAELLQPHALNDFAPNGLQVAGKAKIRRLVTGVTASVALLDAAVAWHADALVVHHGYFWKGEDPCIVGQKYHRLKRLLQAEMNLYAYHLPLDIHPIFGNNVQLARLMGWQINGSDTVDGIPNLFYTGQLSAPCSPQALAEKLTQQLQHRPLHIAAGNTTVSQLAWCTGAAHRYLSLAVARGVDAFVTGEISEPTVHLAREMGVELYAAGHHATERYGVKALGAHLAEHWGLEARFIDIENPI